MIRYVLEFLLLFGGLFALFWNIKHWKFSVAKHVATIAFCAFVSALATIAVLFISGVL